jgi:hypothetical protein
MRIDTTSNNTNAAGALAQIMIVAQASMDLWDAENTAVNTRYDYHESIRCYEEQHGPLKGLLSARSKAHAAVRKFTAETYEAYMTSKRKVYNAKRRLNTACLNATLLKYGIRK